MVVFPLFPGAQSLNSEIPWPSLYAISPKSIPVSQLPRIPSLPPGISNRLYHSPSHHILPSPSRILINLPPLLPYQVLLALPPVPRLRLPPLRLEALGHLLLGAVAHAHGLPHEPARVALLEGRHDLFAAWCLLVFVLAFDGGEVGGVRGEGRGADRRTDVVFGK